MNNKLFNQLDKVLDNLYIILMQVNTLKQTNSSTELLKVQKDLQDEYNVLFKLLYGL